MARDPWYGGRMRRCHGHGPQPPCEHAGPPWLCRLANRRMRMLDPDETCPADYWPLVTADQRAAMTTAQATQPQRQVVQRSHLRHWLGGFLQCLLVVLRHRPADAMARASRRAACFGDASNPPCTHVRRLFGVTVCGKCGCLLIAKMRAAWASCPERRWRPAKHERSNVLCAMRCMRLIDEATCGGCGG